MITMFSITQDNKKFTFRATCNNKYTKGAAPTYNYTCNNRAIAQADYARNEQAFRATRPILNR